VAELLWQQREDTGPASRAYPTMAYEAPASRTILFGGVHWGDYYKTFNDTWGWDGEGWVQLADTGPDSRYAPKLAFDADRQVTVDKLDPTCGLTLGNGTARLGHRSRTSAPRLLRGTPAWSTTKHGASPC
jgi:hypothetical protein